MKFYVTIEGIQKIKRSFLNLKLFSIINVPEILSNHGYTYENIDEYGSFIVVNKIKDLIKNYTKSKRIKGIIYSNPQINKDLVYNLYEELESSEKINQIVLLDDYNVPKLKDYYDIFEEIIFFPSIKKIRLIECKPLSLNLNWDKKEKK